MPAEPYGYEEQEHEARNLGTWIFIGSELMLFGGLFLAYTMARMWHPEDFIHTSRELKYLLGGLNTAVLLTSSTTMAFAVEKADAREWKSVPGWLLTTALLGLLFLGIKTYEWSDEYFKGKLPTSHFDGPSNARLFYWFYFIMTGLHAMHLSVGVLMVLTVTWMVHRGWRGIISPLGLYWHLVDLFWFFIYPLLYLVTG